MFGHYSYLISTLVFAGVPTALFIILFYKLLIPEIKLILKVTGLFLVLIPIQEITALSWNAWKFSGEKSLGIYIAGAYIESLLVTLLISIALSSFTIICCYYQDKGKSIMKEGWKDIVKGKFTVW